MDEAERIEQEPEQEPEQLQEQPQEEVGVGEPQEEEQLVWNGFLGQRVRMKPSELQQWGEEYEKQRAEAEAGGTLGQFRFTPDAQLLRRQVVQQITRTLPQMPQMPQAPDQLQPGLFTWVDHYFIDEMYMPAQYARTPTPPPLTVWSDNVTLEEAMRVFTRTVNQRWQSVADGTRWILRNAATTVSPQVFASWTKTPGGATPWPAV